MYERWPVVEFLNICSTKCYSVVKLMVPKIVIDDGVVKY